MDANYSLAMETEGKPWLWPNGKQDLFQQMAKAGVTKFRVRLWTSNEGQNGKNYATDVVKRTAAAGLDPYLVIFLSEDWADMVKQPAPAKWKDLTISERAVAVRDYSRDIVKHFRSNGLRSHLYEIGNEIDYGICGVYPGKSTKKNPQTLRAKCWPEAAELIRASQAGVREADPEARFMLHIAHWWDADFCEAFFKFMLTNQVQVDFAGLSYFPSSNIGGSLEMEQFGEVATKLNTAIQRPIVIPETAYPSTSDFRGQFSRWKKETPGYPLTPMGQQQWLADFLAFCENHKAIESVYYWSPEWYGDGMWKAFALFDVGGDAKPAWTAFNLPPKGRPHPKLSAFFEITSNAVVCVAVEAARQKAAVALGEELQKFGGINTNYIKAITERELIVGDYRVNLRASLMGNLDLTLQMSPKQSDWKTALVSLNPTEQKLVLFIRTGAAANVQQIQSYAKERGIAVLEHTLDAEKPLKFGLGQGWRDDAD